MLVRIFGKKDCGFCEAAMDLANEYEIPWIYRELDTDFTIEHFSSLFPEAKTFPQIVVDDIHVGGYSDFEEVLEWANE